MSNNKIYPNVELGDNVTIEDFCVIGRPPKNKEPGELKTVIGNNSIIRSNTIIYSGTTIGNNFQTGHHVLIREKNDIGNRVSIGTGSCIEHRTTIGDNVRIHSQAFIPEYSNLKDSCWIGPNVVFTNAKYPQSIDTKDNLKGPIICNNAKIGANSTLLPEIKIGKNALIGAGSVVVKDVLKNKVVVGNPAKEIKSLKDIEKYNTPKEE